MCTRPLRLFLIPLAAHLLMAGLGAADSFVIPNPPEPTPKAVFAAAGVDPTNPQAVWEATLRLLQRHPGAIDDWVPSLRAREHSEMVHNILAEWMKQREAQPGRPQRFPPPEILNPHIEALIAQRPLAPARQLDLLLRRLGEIGSPQEFPVSFAEFARTPWGRWKAYASAQDIMARSDPQEVLQEARRIGVLDAVTLAMLAGDLEPDVAVRYGRVIRADLEAAAPGTLAMSPGTADIWLGWAMASAAPAAADELFNRALDSHDPAIRLAAGSGLMALGRSVPPFRLTAPPEETAQQREQWLAGLKPQALDQYWRPDPLSLPVVQRLRGGRVDLVWLNERAEVVRRQEDVWTTLRGILPDGTFWSVLPNYSWNTIGLTSPEGDVYTRMFGAGSFRLQPVRHGGLLLQSQPGGVSREYAPWGGEPIWSIPLDGVRISRNRQGRFLYSDRDGLHVIDRRGDIIWTAPAAVDPFEIGDRHAEFVARDKLLLAAQTRLELHHTKEGMLHRFDGFTSIGEVRYQESGPWLVIDASSRAVILHPDTGERFEYDLRWSNDDPNRYSRWHSPNEPFAR